MSIRLAQVPNDNSICVKGMKDGQIAKITKWGDPDALHHHGKIVQRHSNSLFCLGESWGQSWSELFIGGDKLSNCRVEIIQNNTTLIVENNE